LGKGLSLCKEKTKTKENNKGRENIQEKTRNDKTRADKQEERRQEQTMGVKMARDSHFFCCRAGSWEL
jgi:hypothetical protein